MEWPFQKKKKIIEFGGQKIELEPKPPQGILGIFAQKPKPFSELKQQASAQQRPQPQPPAQQPPQPELEQKPKPTFPSFGQPKVEPPSPQEKKPLFPQFRLPQGSATNIPTSTLSDIIPHAERKSPFEGLFKKPATKQQATAPKLEIPDELRVGGAAPVLAPKGPGAPKVPNALDKYVEKIAVKNRTLELSLRQQGIETEFHEFIRRMMFAAVAVSVVVGISLYALLSTTSLPQLEDFLFAGVIMYSMYNGMLRTFMTYPLRKAKETSKNVERDILFAARDMIISLRSGMPLFNAIASVSKGYGDASGEFAKIVDKVQLGMPLEEAIDDTVSQSKSQSFRRIMLQASVSIKAGADVVNALQSIIDQLSQERIIELRSYGQKLNAIAMFYMLFGVILPSMGIAVITILTTFIAIFTVNTAVLEFVLIGITALQIMFLRLIVSSRPVFTM